MQLVAGLVVAILAASSPASTPAGVTPAPSATAPSASAKATSASNPGLFPRLDVNRARAAPGELVTVSRTGVKGLGCLVFVGQDYAEGSECGTTVEPTQRRNVTGTLVVPADAPDGPVDITVLMCPRGCGALPTPPPTLPPDDSIRAEVYRGALTVARPAATSTTPRRTTAVPTTAVPTTAVPTAAVPTTAVPTTAVSGGSRSTPPPQVGGGGWHWPFSGWTTAAAGTGLLLFVAGLAMALLRRPPQPKAPPSFVTVSVRPRGRLELEPEHSVRAPGVAIRIRLRLRWSVAMHPVRRSS